MRRRAGLVCLVLAVVTLGVFAPALWNDFVNYDDPAYITSNTHIQNGFTWESVKWAFTTGHASNWHPLTWLSHMGDCGFFGLQPWGHHLTSILFHAGNALLLFALLRQMTGAFWRSAFAAALFAWHPLRVESVAWVSERKDVLSAMFWLLTMLAYARYARESKVQSPRSKVYYAVALGCFALGLLAKPMLVTLPFVLLLVDYWPLNRVVDLGALTGDTRRKKGKQTAPWGRLLLEKVPFLLLAAGSSVATFLVQKEGGAVSSLSNLPVGARVANAFVSYWRYVGKLAWPEHLSVLYPHPGKWPAWLVIGSVVFVVGASAVAVGWARRRPYVTVGWFWFVGTLVPVIGLVQVGIQSMADRYTYVPEIGLVILVCWGAAEWASGRPAWERALAGAGGAALAGCLLVTFLQVQYWKNSEVLFTHVVKATENNYLAYNNLGYFLDHAGKPEEAIANYRKAIEINPNYDEAQNNLGYALAEMGHHAEAVKYYEAALRINPRLVEAHNNLGNALGELGRSDEALRHYEEALRLNPEHANAHMNYGVALAQQGRLAEAMTHLQAAARLNPNDAGVHNNLGNAWAVQHKLDEAVKEFDLALKLRPQDAQAHYNLGNVLFEQGKLAEAAVHYNKALELKPDNPEANYNLGSILLRQGQREEALKHFQEALRQRPGYEAAARQVSALSGQ